MNFVPGSGSEIGDLIVGHPQIRFISFTGSKEVGLHINELAAKPQPGQKWIKRVVAEMGGKDSIVVAADANVDAAVEGVAVSAFGFQGQKCSACSRAIVDASIYDEFVGQAQGSRREDDGRRSGSSSRLIWGRSSTRARSSRFRSTSRSARKKAG